MSSRTLCTIALMIALSLPVGGQLHAAGWEDTLEQMQKSSSYTEADTNGIRDAFTEAQRQGIPADQLLPRLEEGLAKQVPAARILEVLDREIQALTVSEQLIRQVLGTQAENILSAHPALLERTATLHMQGVSSYELTVLLLVFSEQEAEDRWERYRHGTMLHTALLQWGLERKESLAVVSAAARSAIPGAEYRGILDLIVQGVRLRVPPDQMVQRIITSAEEAGSLRDLERVVLY